jgi:hypothetical protein
MVTDFPWAAQFDAMRILLLIRRREVLEAAYRSGSVAH